MTWQILAIDPSIRDLGWAIMDPTDYLVSGHIKLPKPPKSGQKNSSSWIHRVDEMVDRLQAVIAGVPGISPYYGNLHVVIEMPSHFSSGRGEAARNSSSILKLVFLVASIRQSFDQLTSTHLIPVQVWKGNVPKSITRRRVLRRHPKASEITNHNEIDAIGLADWYAQNRLRSPR